MKLLTNTKKVKDHNGKMRQYAIFQCVECKTEKEQRADSKQSSDLCKSCASKTHGMTNSRIYNIWSNMKARCYNTNNNRYQYYGEKGITVCDEWKTSFEAFNDWAHLNEYTDTLTIDRIDNDKGYNPENCRWVTASVQAANRDLSDSGKSKYAGVSIRYTAQVRYEGKLLYSKDCKSELDAAICREWFIVKEKLPHYRNFPSLTFEELDCLYFKITKGEVYELPNNATQAQIQEVLNDLHI